MFNIQSSFQGRFAFTIEARYIVKPWVFNSNHLRKLSMPFRPLWFEFKFFPYYSILTSLRLSGYIDSVNCRIVRFRIGKHVEGSGPDLRGITSWRLAGVPAEIRAEYLSNTSVKRYRYVTCLPPPIVYMCVCTRLYIRSVLSEVKHQDCQIWSF
jgi:hypothetical protein